MKFNFICIACSLLMLLGCEKKTSYFDSELSMIQDFIKKEPINSIISDTKEGIFYKTLTTSDSKIFPGKGSYVSVKYTIKYIDGSIAQEEKKQELYLYQAPVSWQKILPKITQGQDIIIISTSNISYSKEVTDSLKIDSQPLYFDISLLSIQ